MENSDHKINKNQLIISKLFSFEFLLFNKNLINSNLLLKKSDPKKFKWKYGSNQDEFSLMKQT